MTYENTQVTYSGRPEPPPEQINERLVLNGHANEILPRLYLGDQYCTYARMLPLLEELGITGIVSCVTDKEIPVHGISGRSGIAIARIAIGDNESSKLLPYFDGAADFIKEHHDNGNAVLVHCMQGVSRSAAVMIACLMKTCSMSRDDAYTHVKSRRKLINPNVGFWRQLEQYESNLSASSSGEPPSLDDDWCRASCAKFNTCGEAFVDVAALTSQERAMALEAAFDFVLSRGMQNSDMQWMKGLYSKLGGGESLKDSARSIVFSTDFLERWESDFKQDFLNGMLRELEATPGAA